MSLQVVQIAKEQLPQTVLRHATQRWPALLSLQYFFFSHRFLVTILRSSGFWHCPLLSVSSSSATWDENRLCSEDLDLYSYGSASEEAVMREQLLIMKLIPFLQLSFFSKFWFKLNEKLNFTPGSNDPVYGSPDPDLGQLTPYGELTMGQMTHFRLLRKKISPSF